MSLHLPTSIWEIYFNRIIHAKEHILFTMKHKKEKSTALILYVPVVLEWWIRAEQAESFFF